MVNINLELAWEAIQEIYPTYANIFAYKKNGLPTFCSFGEKTYLIKISKRKVEAYYDVNELEKASEDGLKDFLNEKWRAIFVDKAEECLSRSKIFVDGHKTKNDLGPEELFDQVRLGSKILADLFVVFQAGQPQYTSLVSNHLKSLLPNSLSDEEKEDAILTLSMSTEKTPLLEEEIAWSRVILSLKKKFENKIPALEDYGFSELDLHAEKYGLLRAADGLKHWTKSELYVRLKKEWEDKSVLNVEKEWNEKVNSILRQQEEIKTNPLISEEVIKLCHNIAVLGHYRLCIRVNGWMQVIYVLIHELFPQLEKHVPYTKEQLESCRFFELENILGGDYSLSQEELNQRFENVLFGFLEGEEVLWVGKKAEDKLNEYLLKVDLDVKEVKGQVAMKGQVTGQCYVINWDSNNLAKQIDEMPEKAILVAGQTRPQLMSAIKKASAIVTDEGGLLSHAAIVSRELGIPSVIGTKYATKVFKDGDLVELDANVGVVRKIE